MTVSQSLEHIARVKAHIQLCLQQSRETVPSSIKQRDLYLFIPDPTLHSTFTWWNNYNIPHIHRKLHISQIKQKSYQTITKQHLESQTNCVLHLWIYLGHQNTSKRNTCTHYTKTWNAYILPHSLYTWAPPYNK